MKRVFKKNQIVIAVLAVMIAAAGYLNYSGKIFGSKNKTAETGSEMANKELLDISDLRKQMQILQIRSCSIFRKRI